jgi:hypothetical protein
MSLMAKSARTAAGKTLITNCGSKLRKRGHKALHLVNRKNPLIASHNTCAPVVTRRLTCHGDFVPTNEVADTAGL